MVKLTGIALGYMLMSSALNVQGDVLPPTVRVDSPLEGAVITGSRTLSLNAIDEGSGLLGAPTITACGRTLGPVNLVIERGGSTPAEPTKQFTATHVWDTTAFPDGTCMLSFVVSDCNNNLTTVNRSVTIDNIPDTPPPAQQPGPWRYPMMGVIGVGALKIADAGPAGQRIYLDYLTVENTSPSATTTVRLIAGQGSGCGTLRENLSPAYTLGPFGRHTFEDRPVPAGKNLCTYTTTAGVTVRGELKWRLEPTP